MIYKELQNHNRKSFTRNPMFEKNLVVIIIMFIVFAILSLELFLVGVFLDKILLKINPDSLPIFTFNQIVIYILMFDFLIKFTIKNPKSIQILPYLTLPLSKNKLLNFLLIKEFINPWNLYLLFLVVPFALISIPDHFSYLTSISYIVFFYLLCIINSLLVNISNIFFKRNGWLVIIPYLIIAIIVAAQTLLNINFSKCTEIIGDMLLNHNPIVWLILIILLAGFWLINRSMMKGLLYKELQGAKIFKVDRLSKLSFFEKFGEIGTYVTLEIKMILRSKRIKSQLYAFLFIIPYYFFLLYVPSFSGNSSDFMNLFFSIFVIGGIGLVMSQYMFMAESSFFDGLMSRPHNIFLMIKAKYYLYVSYSSIMFLLMLIPMFHGKFSFLFLCSVFFFAIGPVLFIMYQNAIYNKTYFDLFESGMFNWKGISGNTYVISLLGIFIPIILVLIIGAVFSDEIAYWFMLITGVLFTFTSGIWIKWTYNRFLKRKYKNMEGFRSNA